MDRSHIQETKRQVDKEGKLGFKLHKKAKGLTNDMMT